MHKYNWHCEPEELKDVCNRTYTGLDWVDRLEALPRLLPLKG